MKLELSNIVLKHVCNPVLRVEASAGGILSNCIKECLVVAIANEIKVELVHNQRPFVIDPQKILYTITSQAREAEHDARVIKIKEKEEEL